MGKRRHDLLYNCICLGAHFLIVGILYRMSDENTLSIQHPQCLGLGLGCVDKFRRCDRHRGRTLNLEPYRVMQTARSTGASVSQGFYDKIVVFLYLPAQFVGRRLGERGLCVTIERHVRQTLAEQLL